MKILVCLKQVPDSAVRLGVAADGRSVATDGMIWSISPNDEFAIEIALGWKDADPATVVEVVSVGPERSRDALRHALAMGCDDATLIVDDGALGPAAVARVLAAAVREKAADLVLCGRQASDDDQGFVGPALAVELGYPHVSMVVDVRPGPKGAELVKEVEGGHEVWDAAFPVVALVHRSPREPRYPSLPRILKAKRSPIAERQPAELGVDLGAPPVEILNMVAPPPRGGGRIFRGGDLSETAAELVRVLREEEKVL